MKRLFIVIVLLSLSASLAIAENYTLQPNRTGYERNTTTVKVFDGEVLSASGDATSSAIKMTGAVGYFSLQEAITGDGTVKFEYLLSLDGINYLEPSAATDIATGQTKTSGPGSDGQDIISFEPPVAPFMKIKVTETGGANGATITAFIALQ